MISNPSSYAPVVLFVYNRPYHTKQTIEALKKNSLSFKSELFIFADGAKTNATEEELKKIIDVRNYIETVNGFKSVTVKISQINKGLAQSIIDGVTEIIERYGRVIVLEDDIVTGTYFLEYMNTALDKYRNDKDVWHITGWHEPREDGDNNKSFLYPVMDCWSWGTWSDRWSNFERDSATRIKGYDKEKIFRFNVDGLVPDKWNQMIGNYEGINDTWAVFWYAIIFENEGLCLCPSISLVKNIGFDRTGTHGNEHNMVIIDNDINHKITIFPSRIEVDKNEYEAVKNAYIIRYRYERSREKLKSFLPSYVIRWYRKRRKQGKNAK